MPHHKKKKTDHKAIVKLEKKVKMLEAGVYNFYHYTVAPVNLPTVSGVSSNTALDTFVNSVYAFTNIPQGDGNQQRAGDIQVKKIDMELFFQNGVASDQAVNGPVIYIKCYLVRFKSMKGNPVNAASTFITYGELFATGNVTVAAMAKEELFLKQRPESKHQVQICKTWEFPLVPQYSTPAATTYPNPTQGKMFHKIKFAYKPKNVGKTTYLSGTTTGASGTWMENHYALVIYSNNIAANTQPPQFSMNSTMYYEE